MFFVKFKIRMTGVFMNPVKKLYKDRNEKYI